MMMVVVVVVVVLEHNDFDECRFVEIEIVPDPDNSCTSSPWNFRLRDQWVLTRSDHSS